MSRARMVTVTCASCGKETFKAASHVSRTRRIGGRLFCGSACSGLSGRKNVSRDEKRRAKAAYDREYRAKQGEVLRQKKLAAYRRKVENSTDDLRRKQAETRARQKASGYRAAYLKSDRYRQYKHGYDTSTRSKKRYGEYAECHRLLIELEKEIRRRCPDKYERLKARGYYERQNEKCRLKRKATRMTSTPQRSTPPI